MVGWKREMVKPFASRGTMNAEMPFGPFVLSVTANTVKTFATCALVMKCFVPFRTHPSPRLLAVVEIDDASDPAPGSVSANAPIHSPVASFGRYCFFCASLPRLTIAVVPMPQWVPMIDTNPAWVRPSSWYTSAFASIGSPSPPNSSGMVRPKSPSAPAFFSTAAGISSSSSIFRQIGSISASVKSRTERRSSSHSVGMLKSTDLRRHRLGEDLGREEILERLATAHQTRVALRDDDHGRP